MTRAAKVAGMDTDALWPTVGDWHPYVGTGTATAPGAKFSVVAQAPSFLTGVSPTALERRMAALEEAIVALREEIEAHPIAYNAQLFDLGDVRYTLRCPLIIVLEAYAGEVIARVPEYNVYASGPSDAEAMARLKTEIANTYQRLRELGPEKLAPVAMRCLAAMETIIERRDG